MPHTGKETEYEYESSRTESPVYEECVPDPDRPGVWTIPGYIAYRASQCDANGCLPVKGVDNPAFHDMDIPNVHFMHTNPVKQKISNKTPPSTTSSTTSSSTSSTSSTPAKLKRTPLLRMWNLRVSKSVRRDRRATALLCVLVTALVLLLATIAVALYLTVGGGLARLSSSSSADTRAASRQVEGSFRITNRQFVNQLADLKSDEFIRMSSEIVSQVHALFLQSSMADEYNSTEVISLRNGSVIVNLLIRLQSDVENAAKKLGMAFERGLRNEYGQTRLADFVIDFPSIRFSVTPETSEPFTLMRDINQIDTEDTWFAHTPPDNSLDEAIISTTSTSAPITTRTTSEPASKTRYPTSVWTTQASRSSSWTTSSQLVTLTSVPLPNAHATPSPRINFTHLMRIFPSTPPRPPTFIRATLPPDRNFHRHLPFPLQSARTAADLLVQWSEWSPWSECETGRCPTNQTQVRTRECRTKNGTGPRLNDTRLCALLGGVEMEVKQCPCTASFVPKGLKEESESFTMSSNANAPTPRLCHECLPSEVCLALHDDLFPFCRDMKDPKDPLGCRGWCDTKSEYCQHLGNGSYRCVDDRLCLIDELRCNDGLCVPKEKRCDGHFNCYDMTDELDCDCQPGFFHCGNQTSCIPDSKKCDGVLDCWDGEDEANCPKPCDLGFFACNIGHCIPEFRFCDDFKDCSDGSDEPTGCAVNLCAKKEYRCNNGRCLPSQWLCDGLNHCGDGSDELNCSTTHSPDIQPEMIYGCGAEQFSCSSGACVNATAQCDGIVDCTDLSDEMNCTNSSPTCPQSDFKCQNGSCISDEKKCNNIMDCINGEDELNCGTGLPICSATEFTCENGRCISKEDVCDLVNDCGDFSDEIVCVFERVDASN